MFRKFYLSNRLPNRYFPKIDVGCPSFTCRDSVSGVKYNLIGFIKHFSRFLLCKQINDSQKYRMFIDSSERRQKSEIRQGTPFDWLMKVKFSLSQKTVSNSFAFQELGISRFKWLFFHISLHGCKDLAEQSS